MEDCLRQASSIAFDARSAHVPTPCVAFHYLASSHSLVFLSLAHILTFAELAVTHMLHNHEQNPVSIFSLDVAQRSLIQLPSVFHCHSHAGKPIFRIFLLCRRATSKRSCIVPATMRRAGTTQDHLRNERNLQRSASDSTRSDQLDNKPKLPKRPQKLSAWKPNTVSADAHQQKAPEIPQSQRFEPQAAAFSDLEVVDESQDGHVSYPHMTTAQHGEPSYQTHRPSFAASTIGVSTRQSHLL